MLRKIKEWFSIQLIKNPGRIVLCAILIFNIVFFFASAGIISSFSLEGTEHMSFFEAAFCTITMVLDAGCISYVVEDIGQAGVAITIICLLIVIIGMISFTGAVIGYVTNCISDFIGSANAGKKSLRISDHFVILGWNNRAAEIVNDMLYSRTKEKIVILVPSGKEQIEKEIDERLSNTVERENAALKAECADLPFFRRVRACAGRKMKKRILILVREGDIYSAKQLNDISLKTARSIIILSNDAKPCISGGGNAQTIKTLMQVADITGGQTSADNQKIIVEITDEWTWDIVSRISEAKKVVGKCSIIPVRINKIHGQILAQFCLMPELNNVYSELFSNKGAGFYSGVSAEEDEGHLIEAYLSDHNCAIPVTCSRIDGTNFAFWVAGDQKDIGMTSEVIRSDYQVGIRSGYTAPKKTVVMLGHNSTSRDIMDCFAAYCAEWQTEGSSILDVVVVDSPDSLARAGHYAGYPFHIQTVEADIYDKDIIYSALGAVLDQTSNDISILILSDDTAPQENIDSDALASLVYVRDMIDRKKDSSDLSGRNIDIVVEIINPKHHDIVKSYSVDNVVISNRYISKMITQISEVESIFDLYHNLLTYDTDASGGYSSKEIYVKRVGDYFSGLPGKTTADRFVRAVFRASKAQNNITMALGYVRTGCSPVIFRGDLTVIPVELRENDRVILFTAH